MRSLGRIPPGTQFAGRELTPPWDGGCLYRCGRCALAFRHPIRSASEYEQLYAAAAGDVWSSSGVRVDHARVRDRIASSRDGGRVLDVGCANGALLATLPARFARFGVEASVAAACGARANGVEIVASTIDELACDPRRYDVICAVDVIEHVVDPRAFLRTLARQLRPGGSLLVSTGDVDAAPWRWARGRYWYCTIAEHISFVGEAWARHVAGDAGLRLRSVERFAYYERPQAGLPAQRVRYYREVAVSRAKRALLSLASRDAARRRPIWPFGQPGLFADHVLLGFVKPAGEAGCAR